VGLVGVEGLLIRRNLLPMAIVGGIVGIIGLILVYTVGQGMI
jgi:lactate permease